MNRRERSRFVAGFIGGYVTGTVVCLIVMALHSKADHLAPAPAGQPDHRLAAVTGGSAGNIADPQCYRLPATGNGFGELRP